MKIYTIIASFTIGDHEDFNDCWVANYKSKIDAVKAFRFKLKETKCLDEDGNLVVGGKKETVEELFDFLLANGCCYNGYEGGELNRWFVRGEDAQEEFDGERIAWD